METAVQWLQKILENQKENPFNYVEWDIAFEYAKNIEKQQIIEAHGNQQKKSGGISNATYILTGEEYYNEKFKNK